MFQYDLGRAAFVIASMVFGALGLGGSTTLVYADGKATHSDGQTPHHMEDRHKEYVFGAPKSPTAEWTMASGGRLYDNWMSSSDRQAPAGTHPAWPSTNKKTGAVTWRCKSCHGWDYKGAAGQYGSGSYKTGIGGVLHMQGTAPEKILATLRNETHRFTPQMITDAEALRLGMFLSRGLHDADAYIDAQSGVPIGLASRGARYFQNVCAACHGYQGTKLDWGTPGEPAYVGTEANANPWEVLHKIRNGHPGHEMVAMRTFPMDVSIDILAYIRTLPRK